jgi:hypothetical protein
MGWLIEVVKNMVAGFINIKTKPFLVRGVWRDKA